MKEISISKQELPDSYPYRYTLKYLIRKKNLEENTPITQIETELASLTNKSHRSIQKWSSIKSEDFRGAIGVEYALLIAQYFGIEVEELLTKHIENKQLALTQKSA